MRSEKGPNTSNYNKIFLRRFRAYRSLPQMSQKTPSSCLCGFQSNQLALLCRAKNLRIELIESAMQEDRNSSTWNEPLTASPTKEKCFRFDQDQSTRIKSLKRIMMKASFLVVGVPIHKARLRVMNRPRRRLSVPTRKRQFNETNCKSCQGFPLHWRTKITETGSL